MDEPGRRSATASHGPAGFVARYTFIEETAAPRTDHPTVTPEAVAVVDGAPGVAPDTGPTAASHAFAGHMASPNRASA